MYILSLNCTKTKSGAKKEIQYIDEPQGETISSQYNQTNPANISSSEQKEDINDDEKIDEQIQEILTEINNKEEDNLTNLKNNLNTDNENKITTAQINKKLNEGDPLVIEQHPIDKKGNIIKKDEEKEDNDKSHTKPKATKLNIIPALKINKDDFFESIKVDENLEIEGIETAQNEVEPGAPIMIQNKTKCDSNNSNKCWEAAKSFIKHQDGKKTLKDNKAALKQRVYISLGVYHLENHDFKYGDHFHQELSIDSLDIMMENTSILNDKCKKVDTKINTYEAKKNKPCKIEKGHNCPCIADKTYCGIGSKWSKDKQWREVNIHIHPNDMEAIMKEEVTINGQGPCTIEEWVRKIKENMPEKKFGLKYKKDEERDKMKDELSMKILEKLLNKSELFVKLKKKSCVKGKEDTIYEGKSKISAHLKEIEKSDCKKEWNIEITTGPLVENTKLHVV